MYQQVHLLLDDIAVVAAEGDERGPRMHRTPFRFSELHNSHFLHGSNCVVLINWIMKKETRAEDQKLKINLESLLVFQHILIYTYYLRFMH